jgi:Methyltransferase domain
MSDQPEPASDTWSQWLLHARHGGDPTLRRAITADLQAFADRVLDGARIGPRMTLVDIGSGEGLIPFRAIERVGPTLRAILTDISVPMLRHAEANAKALGIASQCSFVACGAEKLNPIAAGSADAVTTRAVLAYVADKQAALTRRPPGSRRGKPSWKARPIPGHPPLTDILAQQFTQQERQIFESAMRPKVESGQVPTVIRTVYSTAMR